MCPVLAVSNTAINSVLAMGLATSFVLLMSNLAVSTLRKWVPSQVRIVTFILIIATFVTIVDYLIQAISLDLHKALGAFISLIVVNCLILGRAGSLRLSTADRAFGDGCFRNGSGLHFGPALSGIRSRVSGGRVTVRNQGLG